MHTEYLGWGLKMTVLGMGLVFVMLALLWALLTVILALDKPDDEEEEASAASVADESEAESASAAPSSGGGLPADLVSAITVATIKQKAALRAEAAPIMRTTWPGSQPSRWAAAGRARQTNTWTPRG